MSTLAEGNGTVPVPSQLLFIGALQTEEECQRNPFCSAAMNRDKLVLFHGLAQMGISIRAVSVLPIACYPRGRQAFIRRRTQRIDAATEFHLTYAPFANLSILKPLTTLTGSTLEIIRLYRSRAWRPRWILVINPMSRTAPAALLARALWRAPLVGLIADSDAVPSGWRSYVSPVALRNRMRWAATRACDAWISYSSKMRGQIPQGRPFMPVWSGLAEDIVGLQRKPGAAPTNVLYSGSLLMADGVEMLLDAFGQVAARDVELRISGRGPLGAEVERRARLDPRIRYYGFVPRDRYRELLAEATVAVNPRLSSYGENEFNFPSKLLEYLGAGCPTITTLTGDVEHQFGKYVFSLMEETPQGLAGKLGEVLALPPSQREAMGAAARAKVLQDHTWPAQVQHIYEFLQSLAAPRQAAEKVHSQP